MFTIEVLEKSSKTDDATRRERLGPRHFLGSWEPCNRPKSCDPSVLAFGYCAVCAPRREPLQGSMRKQFVGYFFQVDVGPSPALPLEDEEGLWHELDFTATLG